MSSQVLATAPKVQSDSLLFPLFSEECGSLPLLYPDVLIVSAYNTATDPERRSHLRCWAMEVC